MIRLLGMLTILLALTTGCAGVKPVSGIDSSMKLEPAANYPEVKKSSDTLLYKDTKVDFRKYRNYLLEPVVIYSGPDNDFGSIPEKDRQMMADYTYQAFIDAMTRDGGYPIVQSPGPDVVRVKFTLVGMTRTTRSLQALTMVNPIGIGINLVKSVSGGEGTFMGNVTLAAEFYDSQSNTLISAFQTKRYPLPIDLIDLNAEYDAAKTGVRDIMTAIRRGADITYNKK